jgi:hypothetical protein
VAARVPRPAEVTIADAPGEPPTYVLPGGVRIYGLGPPPPRLRPPTPAVLGAFLKEFLPDAFAVEVAERWGRGGLFLQVVHLETKARGWAIMRRPTDLEHGLVDAATEALDEALARLRAASSGGASPPG